MDMRLFNIANDWAQALSKYKRRDEMEIVAKETMWGFGEVQRGKRPDAVLKDVLKRIEDKIGGSNGMASGGKSGDVPRSS